MRPRILFILHLPPPVHGAAAVGEQIRRSALVNEAFECRFINLATAGSLEDIGRWSWAKIRSVFRLWRTVRHTLAEFRPDLVYVTATASGLGFLKDYPLVQMIKRKGFRVVVHFHNKGVSRARNGFFKALYRRFFDGIKVLLLSPKLYPDLAVYVREDQVLFCPNGTEDPGIVTRAAHDVPHILFCSNLIETKGVLVLLDACEKLRDVPFVLDIAGGESAGLTASRLQREIADRGLTDRAVYHGRVSGSSKEAVYREADIFTLPTFYPNECFPLVILEAMARSLPVVSTPEGAISEMVAEGETGFIVPGRDSDALADALRKLLTDSSLRSCMGENGRRRYAAEYTLGRFEHRFVDLLNTLLL